MDGGASSTDAFRMPAEGEELTTPFSEFVVRYGHTPRLARNMAAIAGVAAELPPRMEVCPSGEAVIVGTGAVLAVLL